MEITEQKFQFKRDDIAHAIMLQNGYDCVKRYKFVNLFQQIIR